MGGGGGWGGPPRRLEGPQRAAQPRKSARPHQAGEAGVGTGGDEVSRPFLYTSEKGKVYSIFYISFFKNVRGRGEPIRTTEDKAWHSVYSVV